MKRTIPSLSVAAVGLLALGGAASPALGATHTLNLTGPSTAVVGQPVVFQVTGTAAPPAEFWDLSWIDVYAIPASVVSTCPPDDHSAGQLAERTGGAILTIAMRPNKDDGGNFSNQVGATPTAPGTILICAYTANEEGGTRSSASLTLSIQAGGDAPSSAQGAKPRNVKRPRVAHSGKRLTCKRGGWTNGPSRYSYRWLVNGKPKKHATGRNLRLTRAVRGRTVQCSVTASNTVGADTAISRPLWV
jgi:hypothetical protein